MSIWDRLGDFITRVSSSASSGVADVVEAVRTVFSGDADLRRRVAFSVDGGTTAVGAFFDWATGLFSGIADPTARRQVAFSIALIALSAKMAKADGIVTQDEVRAFQEIFEVPPKETRNVARLFDLAQRDVAGFETYAERMAQLCGSGHSNCVMLEDILDGLFHIAKADGLVHEREGLFLHRIADDVDYRGT